MQLTRSCSESTLQEDINNIAQMIVSRLPGFCLSCEQELSLEAAKSDHSAEWQQQQHGHIKTQIQSASRHHRYTASEKAKRGLGAATSAAEGKRRLIMGNYTAETMLWISADPDLADRTAYHASPSASPSNGMRSSGKRPTNTKIRHRVPHPLLQYTLIGLRHASQLDSSSKAIIRPPFMRSFRYGTPQLSAQ